MLFNILSFVTGVFYIVLGIVVLVYKFFVIPLDAVVAYPLGGLLIVYGFFRLMRAYYKYKEQRDEI